MIKRNLFISFSFNKSLNIKNRIAEKLESMGDIVNYSEKEDKSHLTDESIWNALLNRIKGSTITVVILSKDLVTEGKGEAGRNFMDSGWVYKEISASLRDWNNNRINGVIAVAPDNFYDEFLTRRRCFECQGIHYSFKEGMINEIITANEHNVKDKFKKGGKCSDDPLHDCYISVVRFSEFMQNPKKFIDNAADKRDRQIRNQEFIITKDLHN